MIILAALGIGVVTALGEITPERCVEIIGLLVGAGVAGTALEDAASKIKKQ